MIKNIITLLSLNDYKGETDLIDVAKGKYKLPYTFREVFNQFKRQLAWLNKRRQ